jgi:Flp pilus assembly CpaF family ATPase
MPYRAIKTNIAESLNILVHLERRLGRRTVSEVVEIQRYDPDLDRFEFQQVRHEASR